MGEFKLLFIIIILQFVTSLYIDNPSVAYDSRNVFLHFMSNLKHYFSIFLIFIPVAGWRSRVDSSLIS